MNNAVFFLCISLKLCEIRHKGVYKTHCPLFTEIAQFISVLEHLSAS